MKRHVIRSVVLLVWFFVLISLLDLLTGIEGLWLPLIAWAATMLGEVAFWGWRKHRRETVYRS